MEVLNQPAFCFPIIFAACTAAATILYPEQEACDPFIYYTVDKL